MNSILDTLKRKLFLLVFEHLTTYSVNITQQRKLLNNFVKIKKTILTTNCCIKDHSSQVFPNFCYLKSIRSGQLANINYRGTFSTSQFDILIILYQPEKTWLNGGFQHHQNVPFAFILKLCYMSLLAVVRT